MSYCLGPRIPSLARLLIERCLRLPLSLGGLKIEILIFHIDLFDVVNSVRVIRRSQTPGSLHLMHRQRRVSPARLRVKSLIVGCVALRALAVHRRVASG